MRERVEGQPAYVLHERAYRETSALLEVFTRDHGRIGLVVRGLRAQKPRFPRGTLRAFQRLDCAWTQQGELGQLVAAEASGVPLALAGLHLQSALYLNELLCRLLARQDPQPALFDAYAGLLVALPAEAAALGFALRRFEALLLAELGYGIDFGHDTAGDCDVDPRAHYRVVPEHGVLRRREPDDAAISGRALIALRDGVQPGAAELRELRAMMRALLLHHLGGRGLNAWRVLRSPATRPDPA